MSLFRKKEGVPARLVKKGGTHHHDLLSSMQHGGNSYSGLIRQNQQHPNYQNVYGHPLYGKQYPGREIPSNDISESYLKQSWPQHQQQSASAPNSTKGVRKFAPAFFSRKKKQQQHQEGCEVNDITSDDDEETDIVRLEDFEDEHSINPVYLGQLDDSQLNTVEEAENDNFEKVFERRVEYILSHYQKPPPYPGTKKTKKMKDAEKLSSQLQDQDTPLLKQLLKDKQLTDNASMNNFWQAGSHHRNMNQSEQQKHVDKLVRRTQHNANIKTETSKELYEKRNQHYMYKINEMGHSAIKNDKEQNRDAISDIIFPAKGYGLQPKRPNQMNLSASVPDLSRPHNMERMENRNFTTARKPREHIEPGELEALIAHYRKTSLDNFEPHGMNSESISLYSSEGSTSYVPPSPYMSAEIPNWLQVYAKASPDLDQFLKWEMFRYPELDCWQTMLKRLYKKELEQVVLWFEEYRAALSDELHRQKHLMYQQQYGGYQNQQYPQHDHNHQQPHHLSQHDPQQMIPTSSAARMFDINAVGDHMRKTNV